MKRRAQLNNLFEMWDNDASGYLNMEEVEVILKRYKEGSENDAILKGLVPSSQRQNGSPSQCISPLQHGDRGPSH